ncbi:MAG: hypothetical protein KJ732_06360 [Candidatus Margulisbacteria bacterium]|nr:hypothetical protein [Candidatus Margulisiibacteriota bacterium]
MRKLGFIALIVSLLVGAAVAAFWPIYWIIGSVDPATDGASANGRYVYFYKSDDERNSGKYSMALISASGYMLNTYSLGMTSLDVGATYYAGIPNDNPADPNSGYGAMPVSFTISGKGFDTAPVLTLLKGANPFPPPPGIGQEAGPKIKIWFGNRLYQPAALKAGQKFVVSPTPKVEAKISIEEPYAVSNNISDYTIVLDPGTAASKTPVLNAADNMVAQSTIAGDLKAFNLTYQLTEQDKLAEGEHTLQVTAKSSGTQGIQTTSTVLATVEVMGGPTRLIGVPLTWPSPFSIRAQGTVYVQYQLSSDANIEIYIVGVGGLRVKRLNFAAGTEGGSAGINKITWDGRTDQGLLAGNAIYVGTITARDESRLLGKFKLTIVD